MNNPDPLDPAEAPTEGPSAASTDVPSDVPSAEASDKVGPTPTAAPGPRIIVIANQKGGVGKTTTAINLATAMAAVRKRVLVIDLDPQGNGSTSLCVGVRDRKVTSYDVLIGQATVAEAEMKTEIPGLTLVPAGQDLSGAEIELVDMDNREYRLKQALAQGLPDVDYVFIDCPPSLGLITLNAFVAAHAVLVPLQCEFLALEGISQLVKTIDRVSQALNPDLGLQGIVLTMFDKRNNLSDAVADDVREFFGDLVYTTVIPRNVRVSEAPSHGRPVLVYDMHCAGSQAYIELARELIRREKKRVAA